MNAAPSSRNSSRWAIEVLNALAALRTTGVEVSINAS